MLHYLAFRSSLILHIALPYLFLLMCKNRVKWASHSVLVVKKRPANTGEETQVCFLGWEDPLEEGMVTHFSILVHRIPQSLTRLKRLSRNFQLLSLVRLILLHHGL